MSVYRFRLFFHRLLVDFNPFAILHSFHFYPSFPLPSFLVFSLILSLSFSRLLFIDTVFFSWLLSFAPFRSFSFLILFYTATTTGHAVDRVIIPPPPPWEPPLVGRKNKLFYGVSQLFYFFSNYKYLPLKHFDLKL